MMPTFMGGLLLEGIWVSLLAGYLCDALASSLGHHDGSSRAQARTTWGREVPTFALSMAKRVPRPAIAHVWSCS